MGDENPIRTLGDYSKPSHEGYRNTIELPVGNNVDPNQHLKGFLKLVDSLDLDGDNRERTRLRLFQFSLRDQASNWLERLPAGSITTWEDLTTRFLAQFFPPGRTAKLRNDILMFHQHHGESLSEAWTRFKYLLQKFPHHGIDLWVQVQIFYDHVDCTTQESIDYAAGERLRKLRPDKAWDTIERLAQYENEGWSDAFTSEEVCFNYENPEVKQLLGIMEHKVDTLMKNAVSLMGKSESAMSKKARSTRGHASLSRDEITEEKVRKFGLFDNEDHQMNYNNLVGRSIHSGGVVDWEFLSNKGLAQYDALYIGVTFRLGGVEKEMPLLEFRWRVGLYSERESRDATILSGLRNAETVNATHFTHLFWPTIGDGGYNVGNTKVKSIRNPRIRLAHCCLTMTITGRKESTHCVTEIDLFYLYCIFGEGIVCNVPYWLAKYLKSEGGGDDEEGRWRGRNEGMGLRDISSTATWAKVIGRSAKRAGWISKMSVGEGLTLGWGSRMNELTGYMITPFASSSTCRLVTTLSHTYRLIHFLGLKPTTLLMAIKDTCLPATHTAPTLLKMAHLDHSCFILLIFSSLVIQTLMVYNSS
ncbi:zinc finger, CCHC-type containing protein [Tanacetum coccineum]